MSGNLVKSLYRNICKNVPKENRLIYRDYLKSEINKLNRTLNDSKDSKDSMIKLSEVNQTIRFYLSMKYHIERENSLLQSYNINVIRDSKSEIERVANRVGLSLT